MALSIKSPEAEKLACSLAAATGLSITDAIVMALREQLLRETGRNRAASLGSELLAMSDRCAALPDLNLRSTEEILGFDELGLPN